jgi:hypothetical protein
VVIDTESYNDDLVQKKSAAAVRDVSIPVEADKVDMKLALEELRQDIEKKNNMNSMSRDSLLDDIHAFAMESSKYKDLERLTVVNDDTRNETTQGDDWTKSSSVSVCHSVDLTLSHSETASTCSITTPDNSSPCDKYTPTPEPERVWRINNDARQTRASKISKGNYTASSNQDHCSMASPNSSVLIAASQDETPNQALDMSFVQQLDHSKQQQENNEMMSGLCRSYTSSSNDSTCFSSNDFDTSSPLSFSNDDVSIQQGDQDVYSLSTLTETTALKSPELTSVDTTSTHADTQEIEIPRSLDIADDAGTSSLSDLSGSVDSPCTSKTNHRDTLERSMPSDPLESSNLYTNTPLMNTESFGDDALIENSDPPVLEDTNINTGMIFYITIIVLHTKYLFLCRNNR